MDAPGTLHHIMGRGIERAKIFRNRQDREDFLKRLADLCLAEDLIVYAWALMSNHYHLLLQTKEANLSKAIQWLNVSYVTYFNRKRQRNGHLFQGRFKAVLVDADNYLVQLSRHIHFAAEARARQTLRILLLLQKIVWRDTGLFENGPKRALRHVSGMVWKCGVSVGSLIVPDFMTSGGLAIKGETKRLEPLGYFSVPESG